MPDDLDDSLSEDSISSDEEMEDSNKSDRSTMIQKNLFDLKVVTTAPVKINFEDQILENISEQIEENDASPFIQKYKNPENFTA
jgi:hypothetical protein